MISSKEVSRDQIPIEEFFQAFPDPLFLFNASGQIRFCSFGQETAARFSSADLTGKNIRELLPAAVADQLQQACNQVLQSQSLVSLECELPFFSHKQFCEVRLTLFGRDQVLAVARNLKPHSPFHLENLSDANLYRTLVETAQEGIWIIDPAGRTTFVNARMAALLGYSIAEMTGRSLFGLMDETMREEAQKIFACCQQGFSEPPEFRFLHRQGEYLWLQLNCNPIVDKAGDFIATLAMATDITERKREQAALLESETRFKIFSELSSDWAVEIEIQADDRTELKWLSESFTRLTGWRPEELATQADLHTRTTVPEELPLVLEKMRRLRAGEPVECERRFVTANGTILWVSYQARPEVDPKTGRVTRIYAACKDITEQKRLQEQLRENETIYCALYKQTPAMMHVVDAEFRIQHVSDYWLEHLGYSREEVLGRRSLDFLTEESRQMVPKAHLPKFFEKGENKNVPMQFVKKDGQIIDVLLSAVTQTDAQGQVCQRLAVLVDVTEQQRTKRALEQLTESLEERVQERTRELHQVNQQLQQEHLFSQSIIQNVAEGLCVSQGCAEFPFVRFTVWNDQMTRITGYTQAEINRQGWYELLYPDPVQYAWAKSRHQVLKQQGRLVADPIEIVRKDGEKRILSITASVLRTEREGEIILALISDITDRVRTEQLIHQREEQLRLLVESMPVMLVAHDSHNKIVAWNHECERVTGYQADDIIGLSREQLGCLLYPDPEKRAKLIEEAQLYGRNFRHWEQEIHCQDGSRKVVSWSNIADEVTIPGWMDWTMAVDVTERRKAVDALRESEERLHMALQASGIGVWSWEPETDDVICVGYPFPVYGGRHGTFTASSEDFKQVVHPDDFEFVLRSRIQARAGEKPYEFDYRVTWPDGSLHHISTTGKVYPDTQGQALKVTGICQDITQRRQLEKELEQHRDYLEDLVAERTHKLQRANEQLQREIEERRQIEDALRESETRFRQLAENINDVFWLIDVAEGKLIYVSPAYEEIYGQKTELLYQHPQNWLEAISEADRGRVQTVFRQPINDHPWAEEYQIVLPDGHQRWIRERSFPIRNAQGQIERLAGVSRDITESRLAQIDLLENSRLSRMDAEISRLFSEAHDLRSLLQTATDKLVEHLDVALARIWTLNELEAMLELQASSGLYTHLDGAHARIPVGQFKIGRIAQNRQPHLTNALLEDAQLSDPEWARREGVAAFAGYPLLIGDKLTGVLAIFSRQPLSERLIHYLKLTASRLTLAIEHQYADAALRRSQTQLAEAQRIAGLGSWEWDIKADTIQWSDETYRIFGLNPAEFKADYHSYLDLIHSTDRETVRQAVAEALQTGQPYSVEHWLSLPGGERRFLHGEGRVEFDASGRPQRMVGIVHDITERRQAELALRESEEMFRTLTEHLSASVSIYQNGRYVYINPAFYQLTGYSLEEVNAMESWRMVHPDDHAALRAVMQIARETGRYTDRAEWRLVTKAGKIRWAESFVTQIIYRGGSAIMTTVYDLTERQHTEESLRQTARELQRSNEDLKQFAYVISHDLQEPLRMVASYVQLLQRRYQGKLDQNADDFINYAAEGATRMQTLIQDLLTYSRINTRGQAPEPVSCSVVVNRVLDNLKLALTESEARVFCDELPEVSADASQLGQLFQNLISNALKFRGDHPPVVRISVESQQDEFVLSVQDNGIGLDPNYAERIFVIFQRLHTRAEYQGNGIGLAVCKKIVERHGGRIWVESEPGHGATFYFTLPKQRKDFVWKEEPDTTRSKY